MKASRAILLLPILIALAGGAARASDAVAYVPGTEDVPLMPGLTPSTDPALVFDKPQGRIVEAEAEGPVTRRAVLDFYRASLPELGWQRTDMRHFDRAGERLSLAFDGHDGALTVSFTLAPQKR